MDEPLIQQAETILSGITALHEDLTKAALSAYAKNQRDRFDGYDDLKKRVGDEMYRIKEIAKKIEAVERQIPHKPINRSDGQPIPKEDYRDAYVASLSDLGGTAKVAQIMERVKDKMSDSFTPADYRCDTPSAPERPRWMSQIYALGPILCREGVITSIKPGTYRLAQR